MNNMITVLMLLISLSAHAKTDEENVLADWEEIQRSYPQTIKFEKIADKKYAFKNEGFNYDGTLTVQNVIVEKSKGYSDGTADIVVELDIPKQKMYEDFDQSFMRWEQTNYLVFDKGSDSWVRFRDVSPKRNCSHHEKSVNPPIWRQLFIAIFPIILIVLVFWLFMRSMNRGGKNINVLLLDSNLEIAKELKRIADLMEKRG